MATYQVAISKHATLAPNVADTVTFTGSPSKVDVLSRGTSPLFFTLNGTTPTVNGDDCYVVPSGASVFLSFPIHLATNLRSIRIVCATADDYSVTASWL